MLFNVESLSHPFSIHFEPLCTGMYHISQSDCAVSRFRLMLEIYGATPVRYSHVYKESLLLLLLLLFLETPLFYLVECQKFRTNP